MLKILNFFSRTGPATAAAAMTLRIEPLTIIILAWLVAFLTAAYFADQQHGCDPTVMATCLDNTKEQTHDTTRTLVPPAGLVDAGTGVQEGH